MLLHLSPRYYLRYSDIQLDLIDVSVPELNLTLKGDVDIVARTPYPNKCYQIACRKKGRKAINGFFIETDKKLTNFTQITRWAVNGEIATHKIHFHILDSDFDAITSEIMMWHPFHDTPFLSRRSKLHEKWIPATDQPRMLPSIENKKKSQREQQRRIYNLISDDGFIIERTEFFPIHTVETHRITIPFWGNKRFPSPDDAFSAKITPYDYTLKPTNSAICGIAALPVALMINQLQNDYDPKCSQDNNVIRVLNEINQRAPYFFTNTNDLINKAKLFSSTYLTSNKNDLRLIDNELTQRFFAPDFIADENKKAQQAN
ncbi:DUF6012 family protein [Arsenophonus nasoniae]|uniref:DUF6012 family protein n=1 Tax=Arsenophonus nasoniae TaxID=638 RepID=A0AA95GRJ0_9GAMM|nr:DUF6012 family protein [Arsenophonus nasoniae]WGM03963.1 DUF6012 family protein [Arsenophonus nasoniae]